MSRRYNPAGDGLRPQRRRGDRVLPPPETVRLGARYFGQLPEGTMLPFLNTMTGNTAGGDVFSEETLMTPSSPRRVVSGAQPGNLWAVHAEWGEDGYSAIPGLQPVAPEVDRAEQIAQFERARGELTEEALQRWLPVATRAVEARLAEIRLAARSGQKMRVRHLVREGLKSGEARFVAASLALAKRYEFVDPFYAWAVAREMDVFSPSGDIAHLKAFLREGSPAPIFAYGDIAHARQELVRLFLSAAAAGENLVLGDARSVLEPTVRSLSAGYCWAVMVPIKRMLLNLDPTRDGWFPWLDKAVVKNVVSTPTLDGCHARPMDNVPWAIWSLLSSIRSGEPRLPLGSATCRDASGISISRTVSGIEGVSDSLTIYDGELILVRDEASALRIAEALRRVLHMGGASSAFRRNLRMRRGQPVEDDVVVFDLRGGIDYLNHHMRLDGDQVIIMPSGDAYGKLARQLARRLAEEGRVSAAEYVAGWTSQFPLWRVSSAFRIALCGHIASRIWGEHPSVEEISGLISFVQREIGSSPGVGGQAGTVEGSLPVRRRRTQRGRSRGRGDCSTSIGG